MQCRSLTTAIVEVLHNKGRPLTYQEIATEIEVGGLWTRQGGTRLTAWHVYDRIRRCPGAFVVDRSRPPYAVRLNSPRDPRARVCHEPVSLGHP